MQQIKSNDLKNFDINNFMRKIQNRMPFYNERHFQCELGSAINMFFFNKNNIEVLYEMYYPTSNSNESAVISEKDKNIKAIAKVKRNYTDIVICDKNTKEYISIELKYALSDKASKPNNIKRFIYTLKNGDGISIAKKGALDNCRYDFIYDIYRLETLKTSKSPYEYHNLEHFVCGYAIILSNANTIWTTSKRKVNYEKFRIDDNTQTSGNYEWTGGINTKPNAVRPNITGLKNKVYKCDWMPENSFYFEDENKIAPAFKYLVIEIKK